MNDLAWVAQRVGTQHEIAMAAHRGSQLINAY